MLAMQKGNTIISIRVQGTWYGGRFFFYLSSENAQASRYVDLKVINVGSDTFGNPNFQKL